ncbi:hypothetical protein HDU84_009689 [Entophlyctis sp. JEL0112]|nr:hypothetical protein HDU84_009689 [Entophlyctis sp. JEL0112]
MGEAPRGTWSEETLMASSRNDAADSHFLDALLPAGNSTGQFDAGDAAFAPELISIERLMGLGIGGGLLPLFPSDPQLPSPPHGSLCEPPLPAIPVASPSVRTILASDTSREALALLEGPVKKKPGRKKKDAASIDPSTTAIGNAPALGRIALASAGCESQHLAANKKRKIAPATVPGVELQSDGHTPEFTHFHAKLQISPSAPPQTLIAISPTPAIISKRKISISDTDYLTPSLLGSLESGSGSSSFGETVPCLNRKPSLPFIPPPLPTQMHMPPLTKHQERMMKNRASADESRRKHKDHVEKLESICRELVKENEILRKRVLEIESAWELLLVQQQLQMQQVQQQQAFQNMRQQDLSSATGSSPISLDCELGLGDEHIPELGMLQAPSSTSLFELFFGGGDFTNNGFASDSSAKAVKGTVLMRSMSPVTSGLAHYIPRIFLPSSSPAEVPRTLDARESFPLLDASSRVARMPNGDGRLVVSSYLGIEGTPPFLTLGPSLATVSGEEAPWHSKTTASAPFTHFSDGEKFSVDNIGGTLWIAELFSRMTRGVAEGTVRYCRVEAVMGLLFNGDLAVSGCTEPVESARDVDPAIRLSASTVGSSDSSGREVNHGMSAFAQPTPAAIMTTDVARRGPNSVLIIDRGDKSADDVLEEQELPVEPDIIEEVNAPTSDAPPIKSDSERPSVKRQNLARAAQAAAASSAGIRVGDAVRLPPATTLSGSSSIFASPSPVNVVDNEKYCPVANGPVLSLVADLGDDGDVGLRLMLDVQVVGVKLVRY